jgi:regulator of protease activity HflC (stomatin/prohibitin superfamily)
MNIQNSVPGGRFSRWRAAADGAGLWLNRHSTALYAAILSLILGFLALAPQMLIEVPAGNVGVLWHRFFGGTVTGRVLEEGVHIIAPWDRIIPYDVRLRTDTRTYQTIAANGMTMTVEVSTRYHINPPAAGLVHKLLGPDYAETLVLPKIASNIYEFAAKYEPQDFYSLYRGDVQHDLLVRARRQFAGLRPDSTPSADDSDQALSPGDAAGTGVANLIRIEDVMVSSISFPPLVKQAIDRKVEQQQIMEEYNFRIQREMKERDRKRIEAEGIRDFQATVAHTITPEYLRLRGIETTGAFATSTNAKTIIIGGRDGLPVILNTGDEARAPAPAPAPAPAQTQAPAQAQAPGKEAAPSDGQ